MDLKPQTIIFCNLFTFDSLKPYAQTNEKPQILLLANTVTYLLDTGHTFRKGTATSSYLHGNWPTLFTASHCNRSIITHFEKPTFEKTEPVYICFFAGLLVTPVGVGNDRWSLSLRSLSALRDDGCLKNDLNLSHVDESDLPSTAAPLGACRGIDTSTVDCLGFVL